MNTSATQSGVPSNQAGNTTDPGEQVNQTGEGGETNLDQVREPTPRELAMDAIANSNNDRMQAELSATDGATDKLAAEKAAQEQLAAQLEAPRVLADGLDKVMVTVKIDGVEEQVSVADLQRGYQKNGSADRRLAEATQLLREAKAAVVPPVRIDGAARQADSSATDANLKGGDGNETAKAFVSALFEGDEAKALEALEKIGVGRHEPTQVDPSQLAAQLTPAIKQQLVVEDALEKFAVSHADIVKDPHLASLADEYLEEEVKSGKPFTEALELAGKRTRDWLTSMGVKTAEPTLTTDRNTKLERKAGIDMIPALNSKATIADDPVQSATDVIQEMRKARGLEA